MPYKGNFETCLQTLFDVVETKRGITCVLTKETIGRPYTLYGLNDPELNWERIAAGDERVVLCISQLELAALKVALQQGRPS